jgi:hypothetical protein
MMKFRGLWISFFVSTNSYFLARSGRTPKISQAGGEAAAQATRQIAGRNAVASWAPNRFRARKQAIRAVGKK